MFSCVNVIVKVFYVGFSVRVDNIYLLIMYIV